MCDNINEEIKKLKYIRNLTDSFTKIVDSGFDLSEDVDFAESILNEMMSKIMLLFPYSPDFVHSKIRKESVDNFCKDFLYPLKNKR